MHLQAAISRANARAAKTLRAAVYGLAIMLVAPYLIVPFIPANWFWSYNDLHIPDFVRGQEPVVDSDACVFVNIVRGSAITWVEQFYENGNFRTVAGRAHKVNATAHECVKLRYRLQDLSHPAERLLGPGCYRLRWTVIFNVMGNSKVLVTPPTNWFEVREVEMKPTDLRMCPQPI